VERRCLQAVACPLVTPAILASPSPTDCVATTSSSRDEDLLYGQDLLCDQYSLAEGTVRHLPTVVSDLHATHALEEKEQSPKGELGQRQRTESIL